MNGLVKWQKAKEIVTKNAVYSTKSHFQVCDKYPSLWGFKEILVAHIIMELCKKKEKQKRDERSVVKACDLLEEIRLIKKKY